MGLTHICCFKTWLNLTKVKLLSAIGYLNIAKRRKKSFVFGGIKTYKDLIFWEYHVWFSYLYAVSVTTISDI